MKERAVSWLLSLLENVGVASVYPWAFRNIRRLFSGEPERYLPFLEKQAARDQWLSRFFAGHELFTVYDQNPNTVHSLLENLSDDEKEIVREGAAHGWSKLLKRDFETIFESIQNLREDGSYEKRYTAALAPVRYFDDHATDDQREQIRTFWKTYEEDDRKGLSNLVRDQILAPRRESQP